MVQATEPETSGRPLPFRLIFMDLALLEQYFPEFSIVSCRCFSYDSITSDRYRLLPVI